MNLVNLNTMAHLQFKNVRTDYLVTSTAGGVCSRNAFGCLIVVIYDPQHHNGCIAHFSPITPEGPGIQHMVGFLDGNGGNVNQYEILLAGGGGRNAAWQTGFLQTLNLAGLDILNARDHRTVKALGPIGAPGAAVWRQVALHPATGDIAEIPVGQVANEGDPAGTIEYQLNALGVPQQVGGGGWCYLTTACTQSQGLPDSCEELCVLRSFRDTYLRRLPGGPTLIEQYYQTAPDVLRRIEARRDADQILDQIHQTIRRCVRHIQQDRPKQALGIYRAMFLALQSSLPDSVEGEADRRRAHRITCRFPKE